MNIPTGERFKSDYSAIERSDALLKDKESLFKTLVALQSTVVLSNDESQRIARAWVDAWNSRDLARLAEMYSDSCELSSPLIAIVMGERSGRLFGKTQIINFWKRLCEREEKIDFELFGVYRGVGTVVISHRSFLGKNALELMELDETFRIIRSASSFDQLG